jgi:dephospho-CoA kinase
MQSHAPLPASRVPVLGLTGAVGAGKSTAAAECARLGCRVHDVDRMGHDALIAPEVRDAVVAVLGRGVEGKGGMLDRGAVAERAFADRGVLRSLEAIVHPWVASRLRDALATAAPAGTRAEVIDCALLFESGLDRICDHTVCVHADAAVRRRRTASRGWTGEETARREAMQLPAEEKRARAGRVIVNEGGLDELRRETARVLDELAPAAKENRG